MEWIMLAIFAPIAVLAVVGAVILVKAVRLDLTRKAAAPVDADPEREMAIRDSLRRQYSENPRGREHMNVNQNQYLGPGI